ncbi:mechanosensitive ion channel family protein [Paracoccus sediminilitoris]|uniref:mechanosensitive ion channel family protein n=1 Tax=Paracoccus sediminilitoris TaxID=2202419 RepID=UPI00272AB305|nr:mechanosensitive ion channel domain-containing protein [Paracoccus sediminilitoris]
MNRLCQILILAIALFATTLHPAQAQDATFETPALNAGLGPTPDRIDRRTPRAAMASFLRAADEEDWAAAAHVLDLSDIPANLQAERGPRLAHQLYDVIDRKAVLDWSMLNDRPDALQTQGNDTEAMAGNPRRSLLLRDLSVGLIPAEIRLNRLQPPGGGDPIWLFPAQTVRDIPALHGVYGPSKFETALPQEMREKTLGGLMLWEWIGMPLLIAASVLLGWLVHRTLKMAWRRANGKIATGILRAASKPLIIITVTSLIWWVSGNIFVFSGKIDVFLAPAIAAGFVTAILLFIVNGVEVLLDGLIAPGEEVDLTVAEQAEARVLATRLNAARRVLVIVVFLIGVGIVLSSADLAGSLGVSLLASAGALTIILGFAARNLLGNIMASLQIALNQSARVGDRVLYKNELCHVERINMTYVQLRNWDSTRLIVPVEEFVSETFSNWTLQDPEMLRVIKLRLDSRADISALRRIFDQILVDVKNEDMGKNLTQLDGSSVNVAEHDAFGLVVWFSVPCADPNTSWELSCAVRERLVAQAARHEAETGQPVFPVNLPVGAG